VPSTWGTWSPPRGKGQVHVHRLAGSIRVRQVHSPRIARLPPAPTRLFVDDEDGRSDHFDSPR
jgi:hypothetical protein